MEKKKTAQILELLYFSPSISVHGNDRIPPYIDVRYTRYQFRKVIMVLVSIYILHAFTAY